MAARPRRAGKDRELHHASGKTTLIRWALGIAGLAVLFALHLLAAAPAPASPLPILLDGVFGDWEGVEPAYTDASGDGGASGIDFDRLWLADDGRFLFLRFEVGTELLLSENNSLTVYLDTDMNASTGLAVNGIGAELKWVFGTRQGVYYRGGSNWNVYQDDIRLRAFPGVSAPVFEIGIGRDTYPNGSNPLFFGNQVRIFLRDNTGGGDGLPATGETLAYEMDDGTLPPESPVPLGKATGTDLRITTLNVKTDSPWEAGQGERFGRQFAAVAPQILNFQEIYDHTHVQTRALVEEWLPSGPGESWYSWGNQDCHIVSRYPLAGIWALDGNLALLIDTSPILGAKLLVINCHLPCCDDDAGRQAEVDRILGFLRDAKTPGGSVNIPENTPFLIAGDMNFVGLSQQLTSLLTGDIVDEATYGEDFHPDWDESDATDLISRQTERREAYTWRKDTGTYWPGHLDFMIFSDHVVASGNHYVLYTPEMSADSLAAHGLLASDSYATDHILVCADFRPLVPIGVADGFSGGRVPRQAGRLRLDPNPGGCRASIAFDLPCDGAVCIDVFDSRGRRVATPLGTSTVTLPAGSFSCLWDGKGIDGRTVPAGTYYIRLRGRDAFGPFVRSEKWTLLR